MVRCWSWTFRTNYLKPSRIASRWSPTWLSHPVVRASGLPVWATEQYPRGLGPTTARIAELIPDRPAKTTFHCCAVPQILEQLYGRNVRHVTIAGIEAHVCVAQTALELLDLGFRVQVPADAVASRHKVDREFALRRLEQAGAVVSTTEAVLFEWTETADRPEFKAISELIKTMNRPRGPMISWCQSRL